MAGQKIEDIMTRDVETVTPSTLVSEAAARMDRLNVGSLPVCDGRRILGVVTDREITVHLAAEKRDPTQTTVGDIMNSQPAIIGDQEDARAAARVMEEKETHRVFVVDKDGNLVGIVSLGKVARTEDETLAGQVVKSISHPRRKETA